MHRKLRKLVAADGGSIARIVVCPHGPNANCSCRKPKPGLLLRLARHYDTALAGVPVIGDSLRDMQAALAVGARPILVRTGNGLNTESSLPADDDRIEIIDDLAAATATLTQE